MPTFLRSCTILYSARRWSQSVSNHRYNHSKFWLCKCVKPSKVSVKDQSQNSQGFQLSEFPVNFDEIACFGNNVACQTWSLWIYYTKSSFTDQRIIQKSWKKHNKVELVTVPFKMQTSLWWWPRIRLLWIMFVPLPPSLQHPSNNIKKRADNNRLNFFSPLSRNAGAWPLLMMGCTGKVL